MSTALPAVPPAVAPPAPPPETVTLLLVFDVGHSYLTPPRFDWAAVPTVTAAGSPWTLDNGFPPDIRPPLRAPISLTWDPADPHLTAAMADLPWCELRSAHFVFFLEGLAALRVRAELRDAAEACKHAFHGWDNSAHEYERFTALARRAGERFGRLAEAARLLPAFQGWRDAGRVHWIYPLFFVPAAPRLYAAEAPPASPVALGGSHLAFAWVGAQVSPPGGDAREVEGAFLAAALAWQSLHTLDRLLTRYFEALTLRQTDEDAPAEQRIIAIQVLQIFSVHLLDASRPLRWTIRDRVLRVLKALDHGWDTRELRESVGAQNGLAGLLTLHYEKLETRRREKEAARRERANGFFKLAAAALTLLTLFTTIGAVIDLYDSGVIKLFPGRRRFVEVLMYYVPVAFLTGMAWGLWRLGVCLWNRLEGSCSRWVVPVFGWPLGLAALAGCGYGAWLLGNWLWTWIPF